MQGIVCRLTRLYGLYSGQSRSDSLSRLKKAETLNKMTTELWVQVI